jgi:hypothetical protein
VGAVIKREIRGNTLVLAIDPGDAKAAGNICYAASFIDGCLSCLQGLDYAGARAWREHAGAGPDVLVIEKPQMDGRSRKTPPRVLINLAWNGALVAGELQAVKLEQMTPSEWKGSVNKHPHHMRIWRRLSRVEQEIVGDAARWTRKRSGPLTPSEVYKLLYGAAENYARTGKSTKHPFYDVLDAVGLGLRYLGRIGGGTA